MIIAIDGPAGSGKSTVAKLVAKKLDFFYIDTGAMYRALTLRALREKINLRNEDALVELAKRTRIDLILKDRPSYNLLRKGLKEGVDGNPLVMLNGEDVTSRIRNQALTAKVHYLARVGGVRKEMVRLQRRAARGKSAVVEGRDIGTVVFPRAGKKFYLDAAFDIRAERRYKELRGRGKIVLLRRIKKELRERDNKDLTRKIAPLAKADDALYIDTSNLSRQKVVKRIIDFVS